MEKLPAVFGGDESGAAERSRMLSFLFLLSRNCNGWHFTPGPRAPAWTRQHRCLGGAYRRRGRGSRSSFRLGD